MNRNSTKALGGICILVALAISPATAQTTLTRSVIASGAVIGATPGQRLHGTIGQAIVDRAAFGFWSRRPLPQASGVNDENSGVLDGALSVAPSICSATTTITAGLRGSAQVRLTIVDALGRTVLTPELDAAPDRTARTTIDLTGLVAGHYRAVVTDDRGTRSVPFVIAR